MPKVVWNTGVYCWKNLVNGKVYVGGASRSFKQRLREYDYALPRGKCHNVMLQRAWNKYGAKAFEVSILERCAPEDCAERETHWITKLKAADKRYGYNICPVAWSKLGVRHTKASKRKMSISCKARKKRVGWKWDEATKAKISATKKGIPVHSLAARKRMSKLRRGKKQTLTHRINTRLRHWSRGPNAKAIGRKISAGLKGYVCSPKRRKNISLGRLRQLAAKRIRCPTTARSRCC